MGTLLFSVLTAPRFIAEVREVALEHNFVTLRKNYRGYKEPDDYTPVFLPGKSHGQRSLVSYSSWGCKELGMT